MRTRFAILLVVIGAAAIVLGPNQGLTQPGRGPTPGGGLPGGGFQGGTRGGFDPNSMFEQYARGRGFFLVSDYRQDRQSRLADFARQAGVTDGRINLDLYQRYLSQSMGGSRGPSGPTGSFTMPQGGGFPGAVVQSVPAPPGGSNQQGSVPGGMMMMGGDPSSFFDRFFGGRDVLRRTDLTDPMMQMVFDRIAGGLGVTNGEITRQQVQGAVQQMQAMGGRGPGGSGSDSDRRFRERDRNGDGILNYDEMSDTLRGERKRFDANHDGFIDLNEYKTYMDARSQQQQQERAAEQAQRNGQPVPDWGGFTPAPVEEERKPVVYRAGKLPQGLPPWFSQLDTDQDGQVGLYEWKTGGQSFDQFNSHDRNGDGFVTISEMLPKLAQAPAGATATAQGSPGWGGGGPNFGGGGPGRGGDPRSAGNSPGGNGSTGNSNGPRRDGGGNGPPSGGTPPGGGSSGRGGFDPNAIFDRYANGRGFFYINEVTDDQSRQARLTQYAQGAGITDGKITREHYQAYFQQMSSGGRGFGGGPPGGSGGGSPFGGGNRGGGGPPGGGTPGGSPGGSPRR